MDHCDNPNVLSRTSSGGSSGGSSKQGKDEDWESASERSDEEDMLVDDTDAMGFLDDVAADSTVKKVTSMADPDFRSAQDEDELRSLIQRHVEETESAVGARLLEDWAHSRQRFTKVMPQDFKRVLRLREEAIARGEDPVLAVMGGGNG